VLQRQVPRVNGGAAGLVLLGVGVNDLLHGVPPEVFAQRFEAILVGLRARTPAVIVVSNLPDVSLTPAVWPQLRPALAARVDVYNALIAEAARRHRLQVFDACAMTRRALPGHPEYLSRDGFHPSDEGYDAWAAGLWQVVRRVL
jgi:lysophospholipase L1-like esterase